MSKIFSNDDITFMTENYKNMTYKEIGDILGFTERQIRGKLNGMGYTKLRKFDKFYFREIDSDIKAYLLGFIFADGWVCCNQSNRNYELGIQLQSSDKYILDRINKELGNVHKIFYEPPCQKDILGNICETQGSYILRVYSKAIVCDLINHGVVLNKTYNANIPDVPEEYFFDFLRGLIDGDGCYWKSKEYTYLHITEGIPDTLNFICDVLNKNGIEVFIRKENEQKYRLFCTNYKSMNLLIHKMYHPNFSLCLSRKYEKIKHFLQEGSVV